MFKLKKPGVLQHVLYPYERLFDFKMNCSFICFNLKEFHTFRCCSSSFIRTDLFCLSGLLCEEQHAGTWRGFHHVTRNQSDFRRGEAENFTKKVTDAQIQLDMMYLFFFFTHTFTVDCLKCYCVYDKSPSIEIFQKYMESLENVSLKVSFLFLKNFEKKNLLKLSNHNTRSISLLHQE